MSNEHLETTTRCEVWAIHGEGSPIAGRSLMIHEGRDPKVSLSIAADRNDDEARVAEYEDRATYVEYVAVQATTTRTIIEEQS